MTTHQYLPPSSLVLVVALLVLCSCHSDVAAFAPKSFCTTASLSRISSLNSGASRRRAFLMLQQQQSKKEDDDEGGGQTGMNDAFRQLESLGSLDDDDDDLAAAAKKKVQLDDTAKAALTDLEAPSLETEAAAFTKMLSDDDQDAYQDVMSDLGGTPKGFDAASNPPIPSSSSSKSKASRTSVSVIEDATPSPSQNIPKSEEDPESFMNQAIQEALEEARSMSPTEPSSGRKMSDSILDDEEIMKEIEEIFEKGNEKLMASLEEIRKEQNALAKESAARRVQVAMDNASEADSETKERLASAEKSMEKQLSRVDKERAEVEKAVAELKKVQSDLDADPINRLSSSALKPAALAGVLLFSVRSVLDFIAMSGGGIDADAHMTAALIQAGIALVCGVFLLLF